MQQMRFPSILAFVEGTMEQLFLNNNFHYVEVVQVSNGVSWTVKALCQQIVTFFKARNSNADAFVVWVDRERRTETAEEMRQAIKDAMNEAGADLSKLHILICDAMTENVILADEIYIRKHLKFSEYVYEHEGKGGKAALKKLFKEAGMTYRETTHGVAALKAIRLSNCQKSPSVMRMLETFTMPCWWVGEVKSETSNA